MRRAGSFGLNIAGCHSPTLHWDPSKVKLLQPDAVFIPAPQHATLLVLVFIWLRPHREKGSCSLKEVLWGCIYAAQQIFLTFLSLPSLSTQQFTADECC